MNSQPKPKTIVNLLDKISPQDLEKIKAHQNGYEDSVPVDDSWMTLTEFGIAFGWEAYVLARDSKIPNGEMQTLMACKRKLDALAQYQLAEAMLIGAGSAGAKKPYATFKKLTKHLINRMKIQ